MTLIQLLTMLALPTDELVAFLTMVGSSAPDLKPLADEWINRLGQPIDFAALDASIKTELLDILSGKLNPRTHPSDAA